MAKVFISSTVEDLRPFREKARDAAITAGFLPVMQEYFASQSKYPPLEACLRKVDECDVLVVIVAHRHGWTPQDQQPVDGKQGVKSITRLECERTKDKGKEVLAFLIDPKNDWPKELTEQGRLAVADEDNLNEALIEEVKRNKVSLKDFKRWLSSLGFRQEFTNTDNLSGHLINSLRDWKELHRAGEPGPEEKIPPSDTNRERLLKPFLDYHLQANRHLPMHGFETTLRVPIELERVYVCMRANVGGFKAMHEGDPEGIFARIGKKIRGPRAREVAQDRCGEELSGFVDIKGAFDALRKLQVKDMIILGDPGSGKTTLLKYILVMLAEGKATEKLGLDTGLIPFFVPLRDLRDPEKEPFEQFVLRVCKCGDFGISEDFLEEILSSGRGIVLLDGLDEVADEETRVKTCRWIDRARERYLKSHFIVSSRFAGYLGKVKLEGLPVLELSIQDFTPDEVAAFLTRWYETVRLALNPSGDETKIRKEAKAEAQGLIREIESSGHIRKFAVNPLLLQIIALVRFDRGADARLPERRVELYQECTDVLLERWDAARGLKVMLTAQQARAILQPLALRLHEKEGRRSAPLKDLESVIRKSLDSIGRSDITPEALLRNIRDRSGIFMGYGAEEYGFTHLSFQEYLAAEQVRNKHKIDLLVEKHGIEWWREVTLLALGLTNPSIIDDFMERIIATGHFTGDITVVTESVRDSIIKPMEIFVAAMNNRDLSLTVRQNAVRVLVSIGVGNAVAALQCAARGKDLALARAAYAALVRMHESDGIAPPKEEKPGRIRNDKDGSEMVFVPAGPFLYGSRVDDKEAYSNEKPQQSLSVPDFYIGVYPVTNEQYCRFLNEAKPDDDRLKEWISVGEKGYFGEKNRLLKKSGVYAIEHGYDKHPVNMVSWHGATAYCEWAGLRLPGEVEWEKAARGTEGRKYPWGNDFKEDACKYGQKNKGTTPVGTFESGKSPYGCFDMAGNVWEWCADKFSEDNDKSKVKDILKGPEIGDYRVLRGGSWGLNPRNLRCAYRSWIAPGDRNYNFGFRCVSSRY